MLMVSSCFGQCKESRLLRGNSSSACNTPRKLTLPPPPPTVVAAAAQISESSPILQPLNISRKSFPSLPSTDNQQLPSTSKTIATYESTPINRRKKLSTTHTPVSVDSIKRNLEQTTLDDSFQLKSSSPSTCSKEIFKSVVNNHELSWNSFSRPGDSQNQSFEDRFSRSTSTPISKRQNANSSATSRSTPTGGGKTRNSTTEKGKSPTSLCLGDFIIASPSHKRKTTKDNAQSVDTKNSSELGNKNLKSQETTKKPSRRVVPTPLARTTNTFTSPAFRNENNILEISKDEEFLERNSHTILKEREVLKDQIPEITKQFQDETLQQHNLRLMIKEKLPRSRKTPPSTLVDLSRVTCKSVLDRFIEIHSALIDLNLTTNILSEVSYLLNLFNIDEDAAAAAATCLDITRVVAPLNEPDVQIDAKLINKTDNEFYTVLTSLPNCIYFAIRVLEKQKYLLALLDVTTLRVVLDSEHLELLCKELKEFLGEIYNYKLQLEGVKSNHEASFRIGQDFTNVFYQQENDTRSNFPSDKEFGAFKKQRDMFYTILKTWETDHLSHTWNFSTKLGPKVKSLLAVMEHPVNMAHLSKLFTSQLIISSNFSESPSELEIASLNIDKEKLAKLRQRLVAPSDFSADFQFPGNQAFFKDFLMAADSVTFVEQLKIALVAELMERNGPFYETISLPFILDGEEVFNEYMVRPETIVTMQVLGKFLGLVMSKPFICDGLGSYEIDNRQIELRNLMQPSFDIQDIIKNSIVERKLLIIIPWVVQYISMLDYVTLRLNYYRDVLNLLYDIYLNLTKTNASRQLQMRPTSIFILRCCLGWLFDRSKIFDDLLTYRQSRQTSSDANNKLFKKMQKSLEDTKIGDGSVSADKKISSQQSLYKMESKLDVDILKITFDPLLESILNVACPFLADFRVSIMPSKFSKRTSRTGRYRYMTTKMFEKNNSSQDVYDPQAKLTEAFLHSQSLSVRRTVEFVTERTTSAVIKDFQIEHLLPSKNQALEKVKKIKSRDLKIFASEMILIFTDAHTQTMQKWNSELQKNIETRVQMAMDALLPHETHEAVKRTCSAIVKKKCKAKTEDWRVSNISDLEFYSKDISADAEKYIKIAKQSGKQVQSTSLEIGDLSRAPPSKVFEKLQFLLYFTFCKPERVKVEEIFQFCSDLLECFDEHKLPTSTYTLSATMTIYLIQNLIRNHPDLVTDDLINKFIEVWSCDKLKEFLLVVDDEKRTEEKKTDDDKTKDDKLKELNIIKDEGIDSAFDVLLTDIFIDTLESKRESYVCLTRLLVSLINAGLVTVNYLNKQFVALFKEDLSEDILKEISLVLENITKTTSQHPSDGDKSHLFMEMLADLARDIDDF